MLLTKKPTKKTVKKKESFFLGPFLDRERVFSLVFFYLSVIVFSFFLDRFLCQELVFFFVFFYTLSLSCFLTFLFSFINSQLRSKEGMEVSSLNNIRVGLYFCNPVISFPSDDLYSHSQFLPL